MSLEGKAEGKTLVGSIHRCDTLTISAYGIAVKNGFEGTEEEWLASLKGEKGDTGATGPQGPQGEPGASSKFVCFNLEHYGTPTAYIAPKGMTIREWVDSEYNEYGLMVGDPAGMGYDVLHDGSQYFDGGEGACDMPFFNGEYFYGSSI